MGIDLVTGGAGFIGSHIVDLLLSKGRRVRVVDNYSTGRPQNLDHVENRDKLELVEADLNDREKLAAAFDGVERVFHLAALADIVPSIQNPESYFRANVDGTFMVLQAARDAEVKRLVYAASSSCYGVAEQFPTPESAQTNPEYPYALTKYLGEQLVMHWSQLYELPAVSLRLFNVYGPRSRTSGTYGAVFGVFLAQLLAGKPLTIVGDGTQTRDFTFVTDIADAFVTAADSQVSSQVFNVGTGNPVSVNRIVELLGSPEIAFIPKRPGEPDVTHADVSRITEALDWRTKVPVEDGVKALLENIEYWREAPVWTPDTIKEATVDWFKFLGKSA
jgi:UDP-glucose 4-epimerase